MDPEALHERLDKFQVVDVRYPNEWEAGRINGAVHIPVDYLYEREDELRATLARWAFTASVSSLGS